MTSIRGARKFARTCLPDYPTSLIAVICKLIVKSEAQCRLNKQIKKYSVVKIKTRCKSREKLQRYLKKAAEMRRGLG